MFTPKIKQQSPVYVRITNRPIKITSSDPATATIMDTKLNPVTPTLKNRSPKNPPITAPIIPNIIDPTIPPFELGAMKFAMLPAIRPKMIQ